MFNVFKMCFKISLRFLTITAFFSPVCGQEPLTEPPESSSLKDHYATVGSLLEVVCTKDGVTNEFEWRLNGSVVGSGPVLRLNNISLDNQGIYTCHGANFETVETLRLQLGYAPSAPEVTCWCPSYPNKVVCSWILTPDPILATNYISTYYLHQDPIIRLCQNQSPETRQCVIEGQELLSMVPYMVNITAVNALGSATRILPVFLEDIVKPDPPVNIKVKALPGRKLRVQWSPPQTWLDPVTFALSYKVLFKWGNPSKSSIMGPYESESMVRSGIVAGRTYHISVSAMDFLGLGHASKWSDPVNITLTNR